MEPKEFPDLVLLRPLGRTRWYSDARAASAAVKDDLTAVEAHTSNGRLGYLSFTLSPAPKISYIDLHWPYDLPDVPGGGSALSTIVSVDENLILICIDQYPRGTDLFVYSAIAPSPPSLQRLPACDKEIQGLAARHRFLELDTCIGILRRGSDENDYVVADLAVSWKHIDDLRFRESSFRSGYDDPPPLVAMLCTFSSKKREWAVKELHAPQPGGQDQFPLLWTCDDVVPFAGRYLCWIDYYSGLLIHDFSNEDSSCLTYVPFPADCEQYSDDDDARVERNIPKSFRRVAVSQGVMRFIHTGEDCWQETPGRCQTSGLKIIVWSLKMTGSHGNWDIHRVVNLSDLWAQRTYQELSVPHCELELEFPLVIKNDPEVLCCVLREEEWGGKAWIVMLDMKHSALNSIIPYTIDKIKAEIKDGGIAHQFEVMSVNSGPPLVPSGFSKYLNNRPGDCCRPRCLYAAAWRSVSVAAHHWVAAARHYDLQHGGGGSTVATEASRRCGDGSGGRRVIDDAELGRRRRFAVRRPASEAGCDCPPATAWFWGPPHDENSRRFWRAIF